MVSLFLIMLLIILIILSVFDFAAVCSRDTAKAVSLELELS